MRKKEAGRGRCRGVLGSDEVDSLMECRRKEEHGRDMVGLDEGRILNHECRSCLDAGPGEVDRSTFHNEEVSQKSIQNETSIPEKHHHSTKSERKKKTVNFTLTLFFQTTPWREKLMT